MGKEDRSFRFLSPSFFFSLSFPFSSRMRPFWGWHTGTFGLPLTTNVLWVSGRALKGWLNMFRVLMTGGCGNHLSTFYTHQLICQEKVFLLIRAVIGYLSCVCVFILFLLRVTGSFSVRYGSEYIERWFLLYFMHVIVSFQAKFQSLYLCVAVVEGLLVKITLWKWVQGSRLTGVKWLGRCGFHERKLKITWKCSNST